MTDAASQISANTLVSTISIYHIQANTRMKTLKRNVDELEEEMQKEKAQKRKAQRECEEMLETIEAQNRDINSLKTKLR